ncbi:MAG: peptidoglycan-associated lipoprotein Pal [Desulfovibrio sp.]|jgi:peptidoglycan-associated lipoprotein|nr:peptidoglycan-associated lipoprotein Pal [Desulfovibrio sp.]
MNRLTGLKLLCLTLALTLGLAAGCAKKEVGQGGDDDELAMTESERQAAASISNGVIYFEYDRFDLAAQSKETLSRKAPTLKQFPQLRVVIEGHCDERGTEEYNLALGERRARAAYEYLLNLGVPASQMETVSFGKLHPAVLGSGEAVWAKNRRDEFKVFKPR